MRTVLAAGFGLALGLATVSQAFAACAGGHDKQQTVQLPGTGTTTADTATTTKPRG